MVRQVVFYQYFLSISSSKLGRADMMKQEKLLILSNLIC